MVTARPHANELTRRARRSIAADAPDALVAAAPLLGRPHERRQAARAGVGALLVCLAYAAAMRAFAPELTPGPVEFAGTWTSLWCVWITRRQNVLSLPIGIVSVVLMGAFFWQIGLVGQSLLHYVYYLPVQVLGWWAWTHGGRGATELAVTRLSARVRLGVVPVVVLATVVVGRVLESGFGQAVFTYWDASVVAASVVAQLLLTAKKVESWWLWIGPVNVSAIGLYLLTGAYMFMALYVVFLANAYVGLVQWRAARELQVERVAAAA